MYDGFPVDVAEDRLIGVCEECGIDKCSYCKSCEKRRYAAIDANSKQFTDADLLRLAGELERAEEQGWRFERYARCGVSDHRHRWEITSKLCQIIMYMRRLI